MGEHEEQADEQDLLPIIQLYSPGAWHETQAIIVNEAGRELLISLLNALGSSFRKSNIQTGDAFMCDGEGFLLGIIHVEDWEEANRFTIPYMDEMCRGGEEGKIDPRGVTEKEEIRAVGTGERPLKIKKKTVELYPRRTAVNIK